MKKGMEVMKVRETSLGCLELKIETENRELRDEDRGVTENRVKYVFCYVKSVA